MRRGSDPSIAPTEAESAFGTPQGSLAEPRRGADNAAAPGAAANADNATENATTGNAAPEEAPALGVSYPNAGATGYRTRAPPYSGNPESSENGFDNESARAYHDPTGVDPRAGYYDGEALNGRTAAPGAPRGDAPPTSHSATLDGDLQPPMPAMAGFHPLGQAGDDVRAFPPIARHESHATDRASLAARSVSTQRRAMSSIRDFFRRGSTTSRRSRGTLFRHSGELRRGAQHMDGSDSDDHKSSGDGSGSGEGEGGEGDGEKKEQSPDVYESAEQYEKHLEDPTHLLNTILEEPSEDRFTRVDDAAAVVAPGNASINTDPEKVQHRRQGYRENLMRTRRLKRYTKASRSIEFFRKWFNRIMGWSLLTRCFFYWIPLAIILFVPLGIGAWHNRTMKLGGTRVVWIFIWLEVVWASLWIGRLFAHYMPEIFGYIISVFVPTYFKYVDMIVALEMPVQLVIAAFISFISMTPILWDNSDAVQGNIRPHWQKVVQDVMVALLVSAIVYFVEQVFMYIVSTSFHKERMALRIDRQKKSVNVLIILLDMAYSFFPRDADEFADEDESLKFATLKRAQKKANQTNNKMLKKMNNAVGQATQNMASMLDQSGKSTRQPLAVREAGKSSSADDGHFLSAAKTVKYALTNRDTREVLACRIWKSLVMEDEQALSYQDLIGLFGNERKEEVLYMFEILDSDGQDGIDLDEMIESVNRIGKESKQISKSLVDMNGAIQKLHYLLMFVILILIIVIFVGMLSPSSATVLATLGSTLLSLSWLFSSTAQEVFQSCVFLFVKHPYDVGDWIETSVPSVGMLRMQCSKLNLMYSVFNQIGLNTRYQVSHAVLNMQFIANISRSPPSQVNIVLTIGIPETTQEQLCEFEERLNDFVEANPRDFKPGVFLHVIDQKDLDRFSLNVCINIRNNQDDITLFSVRRTRAFEFIGRCINEIPITIPRRDESALNDPAAPVFQYNIRDIDDAIDFANKAKGRRQAAGMRAPLDDGYTERDEFGALDQGYIHEQAADDFHREHPNAKLHSRGQHEEGDGAAAGMRTKPTGGSALVDSNPGTPGTSTPGTTTPAAPPVPMGTTRRRGSNSSRATGRSYVSRAYSTTSRQSHAVGLRSRNMRPQLTHDQTADRARDEQNL